MSQPGIIVRCKKHRCGTFADRKLVHVAERQWIGRFETVPVLEIKKRAGVWKLPAKLFNDLRIELEAEEGKPLVVQKGRFALHVFHSKYSAFVVALPE
jgi:hypothetical protein